MAEVSAERPLLKCPICTARDYWPLVANLDPAIERLRSELGQARPYSWQLCKNCGNAYPSEQPDPAVIHRYWQINRRFDAGGETPESVWQDRIAVSRVNARRSYGVLAPLYRGPPGRFLDIACGLGETVALFRDHGWRAEGIDLDASTKRFHQRRGLATKIGRFEDEPLSERYDLIHIAHAIYFMIDPMAFLQRVRQQLEETGLFGVIISDFLAASAQAQRPGYLHSFFPCRESMRYALTLAGFKPILTRTIGGSIYIAARPGQAPTPAVNVRRIHRRYQTLELRYAVIGRPILAARRVAKRLLRRY